MSSFIDARRRIADLRFAIAVLSSRLLRWVVERDRAGSIARRGLKGQTSGSSDKHARLLLSTPLRETARRFAKVARRFQDGPEIHDFRPVFHW
jgi:hypothetical protein